jgi:hypothetical protein
VWCYFTAQINGKQVRRYKAEWTHDDAEAELAKALLRIEPEKPKGPGITLAQGADRYLASKARKRTIEADRRQLDLLKAEFGAETPLAEITASRISEYKAKRLSAVRTGVAPVLWRVHCFREYSPQRLRGG